MELRNAITTDTSSAALDLRNPKTLKLFEAYMLDVVTFDDTQRAYTLVRGLTNALAKYPDITSRPSELSQGYLNILNLGRAVALPMLPEDEVKDFFRQGLVTAFRNSDINLFQKIQARMIQLTWIEDRDAFKEKLRFELRQNLERLTLQGLRSTVGASAPTVKEWISLAEKNTFEGEPLASAIQQDTNFQGLSQSEKDVVIKLMSLDDLLSLSSESQEGYESAITIVDKTGQRFVVEGGEVRPAVDSETEQLFQRYAGTQPAAAAKQKKPEARLPSVEQLAGYRAALSQLRTAHAAADEARYVQQEALLQQVGSNLGTIMPTLKDALVRSDVPRLLTTTMVLVRGGAVKDLLKDRTVRDGFTTGILKPLADRAGMPLAIVLAKLNANLERPRYVGGCLRWLLETALPGQPAEAARVGHQAEQLLGALGNTALAGLTYFDVRSNQFAWTPLQLASDGMLEWQ